MHLRPAAFSLFLKLFAAPVLFVNDDALALTVDAAVGASSQPKSDVALAGVRTTGGMTLLRGRRTKQRRMRDGDAFDGVDVGVLGEQTRHHRRNLLRCNDVNTVFSTLELESPTNIVGDITENITRIWYTLEAPPGTIEITTCFAATDFDTYISIWSDDCTFLDDNDNDRACPWASGYSSTASVTLDAAQTLRIRIGNYRGFYKDYGTFELRAEALSSSPSSAPSTVPTLSGGPTISVGPSTTPSLSGGPTISVGPTSGPSSQPSAAPSSSFSPSLKLSKEPSSHPSAAPSSSFLPSAGPSFGPSSSAVPTLEPTVKPTDEPSGIPSYVPTEMPTDVPSIVASLMPSDAPTVVPIILELLLDTNTCNGIDGTNTNEAAEIMRQVVVALLDPGTTTTSLSICGIPTLAFTITTKNTLTIKNGSVSRRKNSDRGLQATDTTYKFILLNPTGTDDFEVLAPLVAAVEDGSFQTSTREEADANGFTPLSVVVLREDSLTARNIDTSTPSLAPTLVPTATLVTSRTSVPTATLVTSRTSTSKSASRTSTSKSAKKSKASKKTKKSKKSKDEKKAKKDKSSKHTPPSTPGVLFSPVSPRRPNRSRPNRPRPNRPKQSPRRRRRHHLPEVVPRGRRYS